VQTSLDKADASVQDLAGMTVKVVAGTGAQKTAHRDALGLGPIATMTLPEAQSAVSDAMPRLLPSSPGTTILDFSSGPSIATSVAASACAVAWNPTGWHDGTGCLELTPTTDSYSNFALYFDASKKFSLFSDDGYAIEHDLPNVEDKAANPIASLRIGTGATSTAQPANCREVRLFAQATGIVYFSGPRYDRHLWDFANTDAKCGVYPGYSPGINGAGVAPTDNINWVRFEFFGVAGKKYKIKRLVRGGSARACIVMGTDSAAFDQLTELVNAQMARYGWRWSINQYFGGGNGVDDLAISRRNINAIYKAGSDYNLNDIVSRPLATAGLSAAQVEAMARECATKAHGYGWYRGSDIHIYNNNSHSDTVVRGMAQAGIIAARGGQSDGRFVFTEGGVVNPLRIPSASWDERTTAQMTVQVDRAIEYGATAWVYWHNVFARAKVVADGQPAVGSLTPSEYRATNLVYANNRGIDQYTVWWEELQGTLAYIKAKEIAGQVIVMSPSEWCAANGIR
jgi:hypothetical protein